MGSQIHSSKDRKDQGKEDQVANNIYGSTMAETGQHPRYSQTILFKDAKEDTIRIMR
jgi:hypothetical protein